MDRYGRQKPLGLKGQQGGGNSPLEHAGDDCQAACEYMFFNSQAMCPGGCTPYPQGGTGCSCMHTCTLYNNLIPHLCEVYEYCCQNTNWEDFDDCIAGCGGPYYGQGPDTGGRGWG